MSLLRTLVCLALASSPAFAQLAQERLAGRRRTCRAEALGAPVGAKADYHVHLKADLTLDDALRKSRDTGIYLRHRHQRRPDLPDQQRRGPRGVPAEMRGKPVYGAFQAEGREWVRLFSQPTLEKFDYVFTDAMTWTDDGGRRMRLWIREDVGAIPDPQAFMDMLVNRATGIFDHEPIDLYVNPTFLPGGDRGRTTTRCGRRRA